MSTSRPPAHSWPRNRSASRSCAAQRDRVVRGYQQPRHLGDDGIPRSTVLGGDHRGTTGHRPQHRSHVRVVRRRADRDVGGPQPGGDLAVVGRCDGLHATAHPETFRGGAQPRGAVAVGTAVADEHQFGGRQRRQDPEHLMKALCGRKILRERDNAMALWTTWCDVAVHAVGIDVDAGGHHAHPGAGASPPDDLVHLVVTRRGHQGGVARQQRLQLDGGAVRRLPVAARALSRRELVEGLHDRYRSLLGGQLRSHAVRPAVAVHGVGRVTRPVVDQEPTDVADHRHQILGAPVVRRLPGKGMHTVAAAHHACVDPRGGEHAHVVPPPCQRCRQARQVVGARGARDAVGQIAHYRQPHECGESRRSIRQTQRPRALRSADRTIRAVDDGIARSGNASAVSGYCPGNAPAPEVPG